MTPKEILAANFRKLRDAHPHLKRLPDITAAGGGSNGTLDRITRKASAVGVDALEPLAKVYDMEPWQLLVPSLEVGRGPTGKPVVTGLPNWPLMFVDRRRYDALGAEDRAYAQAKMMAAIEEREAARGHGPTQDHTTAPAKR